LKDLNLIPKSYYLEYTKKKKRLYITAGITIFAGFMVLAVALPLFWRYNLKMQRDSYENMVKQTMSYVETEKQLGLLRKMYEDRQGEADRMLGRMEDMSAVFEAVEAAVPEKVFFLIMNVKTEDAEGMTVLLNGISPTMDGIATFADKIRKDGFFDDVAIDNISSDVLRETESAYYMFTMKLSRKGHDLNS
jgi:Tfp pilus assembly protein PilN